MTHRKVIGALLVLALGNLSTIKADLSPEQFAAGTTVIIAGIPFVADQAGKLVSSDMSKKSGVGARNLGTSASAAVLTGVVLSGAQRPRVCSSENRVKTGLSFVASTAVLSKKGQELVRKVPVVGYYLTCDNPDCQGVCGKCQNTKALQATAISLGINFIPQLKATSPGSGSSSSS